MNETVDQRNLIRRINVGDSLTRTAAARPDHPAVVDGDRRFSYAEFNAYVNRLAHGLSGLGYERGTVLALASGNSADFLAVYYACAKLGVVACRSTSAGGPTRWPTCWATRAPAASSSRPSWSPRCGTPSARCPRSPTFIAPGTGAEVEPEPADRAWTTLEALTAHDAP